MSSDDYFQVSTIIARLKTLSEFFVPGTFIPNPARIAELIGDVLHEVQHEPPGDPDALAIGGVPKVAFGTSNVP